MAGLEEGFLAALWALFKYAVGAADILELDCLDASPIAMVAMVAYSVLSTILLVNMLIAIMAKTFDVRTTRESNPRPSAASPMLKGRSTKLPCSRLDS